MKRYDIPVLSKESIPDILKYFDINASTYGLYKPSYNYYGTRHFFVRIKRSSTRINKSLFST
ncbi:hypothetical protein ['Camptotheca acuminata' phytoplasma]|uniref:hypothetical protein n=1 Tax='Camptotheca acuminata' phytoplasma TaxID=3239192 RepID=UPI00351A619D